MSKLTDFFKKLFRKKETKPTPIQSPGPSGWDNSGYTPYREWDGYGTINSCYYDDVLQNDCNSHDCGDSYDCDSGCDCGGD